MPAFTMSLNSLYRISRSLSANCRASCFLRIFSWISYCTRSLRSCASRSSLSCRSRSRFFLDFRKSKNPGFSGGSVVSSMPGPASVTSSSGSALPVLPSESNIRFDTLSRYRFKSRKF